MHITDIQCNYAGIIIS